MSDAADFFRSCLDQMIDLRHPLAVLASRLPWQELEANVAAILARRVRAGKKVERSGSANSDTGIKKSDGLAQLGEDFACTRRANREKTPPQPFRSL